MFPFNLKRAIVVSSILMGIVNINQAQDLSFGVKGGVNLASMSVDGPDKTNMNTGIHAGAFVKIRIAGQFSLQAEVLYSQKGIKATYDEEFVGLPVVEGETTIDINYIDVPLYLVYNLSDNLNFKIGPYVSFLVDGVLETNAEILDWINIENTGDFGRNQFKNTDLGLSMGLAFEFNILKLGVNYNFGFPQAAENDEASEILIGDARNNVIQGFVGLAF